MISGYAFSQQVSLMNDKKGQPAYIVLNLPDTTYVHHFTGEIPEHISFDGRYNLSPRHYFERDCNYGSNSMNVHMDTIEPGILPEADLPYKVKYTNDGTRIVIIYHHTNNVVVYNAEDLDILADIKIGEGPEDLFLNDDCIYVSCYYSDDIYVIDLEDYSIVDHFYVDQHPSVIEVNQWEDIIYIGHDMGEHWKLACMAAYGLSAHNKLWDSNWPFITQINMWEGKIGRKVYTYSRFELIGDDQYIACLQKPGSHLMIMDALSGELIKTFYKPGEAVVNIVPSITRDTLFMQSYTVDSFLFYRVDSYTHQVLDSIMIPQPDPLIGFWHWQYNLAVNNIGTKMFMEVGNIATDQYWLMVDFEAHDYKIIPLEQYESAQIFMVQSYDKRYVVTLGDDFRIFDFELEDYTFNQYKRFLTNYKVIASSTVSYDFIWCDSYGNRDYTNFIKDEVINIYNFDDPANLIKADSAICGVQPEADLTYSAVLNNKNEKIIAANTLSGNISIIDANTYEVDTILDIAEISSIKQVNDDQVLMGGQDVRYLLLFDIPSLSVIKEFNIKGYDMIIPAPDQQYAYAYSELESKLVKIKLDGVNSSVVKTLDIVDYSAYYITWEYRYWPEISPDGKYIVMGQDHTVVVIDTETMEVVANVIMSGRCMYDMAFTEDGKRVCIPFWYLTPEFDIIYLDGENSYLENTVQADDGLGGMSVEFNPIDKKFYIARRGDIWVVDPVTGIVEDTIDYDPVDPQVQICIDPQGKPIVNTLRYLYHDGMEYHLKEPTRRMYVDYASQKCIIPSPGPDRIYILDFLTTQMHEIPVTITNDNVNVYPNPASEQITVKSDKLIKRLQLFRNNGELIFDKGFNHSVVTIGLDEYPKGIYFMKVLQEERVVGKKVVVN